MLHGEAKIFFKSKSKAICLFKKRHISYFPQGLIPLNKYVLPCNLHLQGLIQGACSG